MDTSFGPPANSFINSALTLDAVLSICQVQWMIGTNSEREKKSQKNPCYQHGLMMIILHIHTCVKEKERERERESQRERKRMNMYVIHMYRFFQGENISQVYEKLFSVLTDWKCKSLKLILVKVTKNESKNVQETKQYHQHLYRNEQFKWMNLFVYGTSQTQVNVICN